MHGSVQTENLCAGDNNVPKKNQRTPHLKYALSGNALSAQNLLAAHVAGSHWRTGILQMQNHRPDAPGH